MVEFDLSLNQHVEHMSYPMLSMAVLALAKHSPLPAPQLYWNSVLPHTKMPKAISDLILQPAGLYLKSYLFYRFTV
ncbi:hypothetical protein CerSpe_121860 [Prunus speciosa]